MWMKKHDHALASGFEGTRVTGAPYWLDSKKEWDDFTSYEPAINDVIQGTKLLVLCSYCLSRCGVVEIMDVVKKHDFAIAMNHGSWQVVRMYNHG